MSELLLPKKSYFWTKKVTCIIIGVLIQLKLILLVNIAGDFFVFNRNIIKFYIKYKQEEVYRGLMG